MLGLILDLVLAFVRGPVKDVRRFESDDDVRRRLELAEREMKSIRKQYAAWAGERALTPSASPDLFVGLFAGREVRFDTGLGEGVERKPIIDVGVPLEIETEADDAVLVDRTAEASSDIERICHGLLDGVELLEKIWLNNDGIRLVFEKRVHPDVLDMALEALGRALQASVYR